MSDIGTDEASEAPVVPDADAAPPSVPRQSSRPVSDSGVRSGSPQDFGNDPASTQVHRPVGTAVGASSGRPSIANATRAFESVAASIPSGEPAAAEPAVARPVVPAPPSRQPLPPSMPRSLPEGSGAGTLGPAPGSTVLASLPGGASGGPAAGGPAATSARVGGPNRPGPPTSAPSRVPPPSPIDTPSSAAPATVMVGASRRLESPPRPASHTFVPKTLTAVTPVTSLASRRIIRRVNLWSVLKVSVILYAALFAAFSIAAIVVWKAANSSGVVTKIEEFIDDLGFTNFEFVGEKIFFNFLLFGVLGAALAVAVTLLAAVMYNLISEVVGGIEITVIEQVAFLEEAVVEEIPEYEFDDGPEPPRLSLRRLLGRG